MERLEEVKKILDELRYENHHTNNTLAVLICSLFEPKPGESRLMDELFEEIEQELSNNFPPPCPLTKHQVGYITPRIAKAITQTASIVRAKTLKEVGERIQSLVTNGQFNKQYIIFTDLLEKGEMP